MSTPSASSAAPANSEPSAARPVSRSAAKLSSLRESQRKRGRLDGFVHPDLFEDEELLRRARLQILFGVLGGLFGIAYAGFYFAIGHTYGGCIIGVSGLITTQLPWLIKRTGNLTVTSYLYAFVLLIGFTGLCAVGGGVRGHAVPWLAAVPLVVLLLADLRSALTWTALAFGTVLALAICELAGYGFPTLYDETWAPAVAALTAVGLVGFLAFLGLIFEQTRREAFRRMDYELLQLGAANDDMQKQDAAKNEFLSFVAHGLRQPLKDLCASANRMRHLEAPTPAQVRRQADDTLKTAAGLIDRVQQLLDLPAIEEGRVVLDQRVVDLNAVIGEALADHEAAASAKGIELSVAPTEPGYKSLKLLGNAVATRQILDNLLVNAIRYTPVGGDVTVRLGRDRDRVVLEVCDTGPGLSADHEATLFRKFGRPEDKGVVAGRDSERGLGLWIVRKLAEAMDGTVFCRSAPGAGSSFGVSLPGASRGTSNTVGPSETEDAPESIVENESAEAPMFVPGKPLVGRLAGSTAASDGDDHGDVALSG